MKQIERRIRALESAAAPQWRVEKVTSTTDKAILVCFALREGVEANDQLIEAGASLDAERRAELTETLQVARSIATALGRDEPTGQTPIPGTLGALLAALWATTLPPVEMRGTRFLRPGGATA